MVTRIALIACSNGLGHTRRLLMLSNALSTKGCDVTLLAPGSAVSRMAETGLTPEPAVEIIDFSTGTTAARLRSNDHAAVDWSTRLPDLTGFDLVVSDNLVEILEIRPDTVLCGHFLWHLALNDVASDYSRRCEALLVARRPRMISTGLFTSRPLAERVRLTSVGLFGARRDSSEPKSDILLSCGTGGEAIEQARDFTATPATRQPTPFRRIHVDPLLITNDGSNGIVRADYSTEMYDSLQAIVCRPGVGTVTEGLLSGARIFCFYEAGNVEMADNAARLAAAGLGEDCGDIRLAWKLAVAFADSSTARNRHRDAIDRIEVGGHVAAADHLLSWSRIHS